MATNQQSSHIDGFDFDAPQFTDFQKIANEDGNVFAFDEEYCQNYFDRKTEEIKRKSDEFDTEQMAPHNNQPNEHDNDNKPKAEAASTKEHMSIASDSDDDENMPTEPIANLLPAAEFANISSMSNRSHRSNKSSKSSRSHRDSALTHLYANAKINKSRHALTTEELQLKRMEQKKMELEKLKEKNAKNVVKMKDDHRVFHPIRSTKLTVPITPALRTSLRAQKRIHHSSNNKENEALSDKQAHSHSTTHMKLKKRKTSNSSCTVSEREASNMSVSTTATSTSTITQSFNLSKSKKRKKRSTVLSSEQKELREIEQYGQFHARKINPKIFKSNAANLGILNNVKNKQMTTTVQPFHFLTEKRARKHQERSSSESPKKAQTS